MNTWKDSKTIPYSPVKADSKADTLPKLIHPGVCHFTKLGVNVEGGAQSVVKEALESNTHLSRKVLAYNHSCMKFTCGIVIPCSDILPCISWSSGSCTLFTLFFHIFRALGTGDKTNTSPVYGRALSSLIFAVLPVSALTTAHSSKKHPR